MLGEGLPGQQEGAPATQPHITTTNDLVNVPDLQESGAERNNTSGPQEPAREAEGGGGQAICASVEV